MPIPEGPDWYLRDWMVHVGKRQADLVKDLGWFRGRASKVFNGRQSYTREDVNQLSAWLSIEPYELLMPPNEAIALRLLRRSAAEIVASATAAAPRTEDRTPLRRAKAS